jgi:alpha-1,2-mannosyltransferase
MSERQGERTPGARVGAREAWSALPPWHRAALAATWLCVLVFTVRGAVLTLRPGGNDFTIYRDASLALLEGRSPLDVDMYIYLPVFAVATIPFALLPYGAAAVLWAVGSLAGLVWSAWACARLLSRPGERSWPWLLWAPTAICLRPIDSCFANGQVNLWILALVLLGATALARGREVRGASWLGLAAALKLVPAIFLAWLAARRRWGAALVGGGVALAAAALVPLPWRGVEGSRADLAHWADEVPGPFARGGTDLHAAWPRTPGQSLTGVIYRLATDDPEQLLDRSQPLAAPDPAALERARWAVRILTAAFLVALFLPLLLRPAPLGSSAWVRELALTTSTALLVAPLVHKAHLVWLILPFAAIVHATFSAESSRRERRSAAFALAVSVLLISGTAPALVGRREATYLLVYSAMFWGALALQAWLLVSVWRAALGSRARASAVELSAPRSP